jgi:hypothetical protein
MIYRKYRDISADKKNHVSIMPTPPLLPRASHCATAACLPHEWDQRGTTGTRRTYYSLNWAYSARYYFAVQTGICRPDRGLQHREMQDWMQTPACSRLPTCRSFVLLLRWLCTIPNFQQWQRKVGLHLHVTILCTSQSIDANPRLMSFPSFNIAKY